MSLFPAYAQDAVEYVDSGAPYVESGSVSPALEAQLLQSDEDDGIETVVPPAPVPEQRTAAPDSDEYYLDRKFDCGNLRVSTLYYPGRPQYQTQKRSAVGSCIFLTDSRKRRYFEMAQDASSELPSLDLETELAERTKAYRQMLQDQPTDEALWLRFIDFLERCRDAEAALTVVDSARESLPESTRIRAAMYRLRARVWAPRNRIQMLREDIAKCPKLDVDPDLTTELWLRLLDVVAQGGDSSELDDTVAAALTATRSIPSAYPHILYVYGGYLRSAGLWERLVLLIELVTSMNFPPDVFPPTADHAKIDRIERELQDAEDKVISSGLPLSTVWVRVERARASAHWHAPGRAESVNSVADDPQRIPLPADVAELLLPARAQDSLLLLVQLLRLAKVPLLPTAGYVAAALDPSNDAAGDVRWASTGEALVSLVCASRRLPAAHPVRAAGGRGARALLAHLLDPPHYFTDDTGYLTWVSSLWEASCSWTSGSARLALLCWRLRWLHALLLLLDTREESDASEARRIRSEARSALKRWAGSSAIPFALFARLEQAAAGVAPARRAALQALRAALRDKDTVPAHRLFVARVVSEVCESEAQDWTGWWACACAVLDLSLPDDHVLTTRPPAKLLDDALQMCETQCTELESQLSTPVSLSSDALVEWALLPASSEWAAARARLASASRRVTLLRTLRRATDTLQGAVPSRYWEASACALARAAAREHGAVPCARALSPLFPHNAYLALACSGTSLWWCGPDPASRTSGTVGHTHVAAMAHVLPALLRAAANQWPPQESSRAVSACARAARSAPSPLLSGARLESEARCPRPRTAQVLLTALDDFPMYKWLYVRGAAWCSAEAPALGDVILERGLRLHALRDELEPIAIEPTHNNDDPIVQ